jgi:hypothetical protein
MKKLLIGIFTLLTIAACKQNKTNNANTALNPLASVSSSPTTLNGYPQDRAITMISNFASNMDYDKNTTKAVSVWFSKEQINAIDTLLENEVKTKGTDGIRFYFACDAPLTTTKLELSIFLVSTKTRNPTVSGLSDHQDYYDHTSNFLGIGVLGDLTDDAQPTGALLYNKTTPCTDSDNKCDSPSTHYLNCDTVYSWVGKHTRGAKPDLLPLNTKAEWFSLCFINSVNNALQDAKNNLDGLRVYLGKGYYDSLSKKTRDVFILVPTYYDATTKGHVDYYQCLEDLESKFCSDSLKSSNKKSFHTNGSNYFFMGGYDNGQLCPYNCN